MREIKTEVNGIETTLLVDDADAKRIAESNKQAESKARKSVENKSS